jgi:glycerate kinase
VNRIRIVCAPDSFKESMSALEAANAMAAGVRRVLPEADCVVVPMADGGEGTVQALVDALGGRLIEAPCHDALGRPTTAGYAWVEGQNLAVIEMAAASGLAQIDPAERDVRRATSVGVGELIGHALDLGARRFIVGLGGSATNDAGAGLAQALGVRLLDRQGEDLPPGGAALARLDRVDLSGLDPRLAQCHFDIACDVDNPLLGPRGASAIFGPQKGADPATVAELDAALTVWADRVEAELGRPVRDIPGAGAAGGLGAAFAALTASTMRRGIDIVVEAVGLADLVVGADWVLTGEGSVDSQTLHGKVPWGVARTAAQAGVPAIIFGGRVAPGSEALLTDTTVALVPILKSAQDLPQALVEGPHNLADAAETTMRLLLAGASWSARHAI